LFCLLLFAASCGNRSPRPVEIEATDMCTQCKMAISEKRYAADLTDMDGNVIKFDNIDCMVPYAAAHGLKDKAAAYAAMVSTARRRPPTRMATRSARISMVCDGQRWQGMAGCASGFSSEIYVNSRPHGQQGSGDQRLCGG
jgi:hypothetical protein